MDQREPVAPFTQVRNDLFDEAGPRLNDAAFRLAMIIARHTAGWQRESVDLSIPQLMAEARKSKQGIRAAVRELRQGNIITVTVTGEGRARVSTYRMVPRCAWKLDALMPAIGLVSDPMSNGQVSDPIPAHIGLVSDPIAGRIGQVSDPIASRTLSGNKRELKKPEKESLSSEPQAAADAAPVKKPARSFAPDSEPMKLARYLRDAILAHKPDARVPKTDAVLAGWAGVLDLMLRVDNRAPPTIRAVIDWATNDTTVRGDWHGWQSQILSPGSLREKFDRLQLQAQERKNGNGHTRSPGTNGDSTGSGGNQSPPSRLDRFDNIAVNWREARGEPAATE